MRSKRRKTNKTGHGKDNISLKEIQNVGDWSELGIAIDPGIGYRRKPYFLRQEIQKMCISVVL